MVIDWLKKLAKPQQEAPRTSLVLEPREISQEQIARRAYEKWVARGRPEGTSTQDWLEAEAELRSEFRPKKPR